MLKPIFTDNSIPITQYLYRVLSANQKMLSMTIDHGPTEGCHGHAVSAEAYCVKFDFYVITYFLLKVKQTIPFAGCT